MMKIKVFHRHITGNVKQGYNQLGSIFRVDGISPTLDLTRKRYAIPISRFKRLITLLKSLQRKKLMMTIK
jgi:hypothetical protein